jgi:hypothetical protein
MNELFLVLLIVCTLITFIQFNKKLGVATVIPGTFISNKEHISSANEYKDAVYKNNNNRWSATVTAESNDGSLLLVYDQYKHTMSSTQTGKLTSSVYIPDVAKYDFVYA